MKKIINTPKGTFELELTAEEIAQREIDAQKEIEKRQVREQDRQEKLAKEQQKQANKQSALNKLSALGLTADEIKAIIGN